MKEGHQRPVDGLAAPWSTKHPSNRRGGPTRAFRGLLWAVLLSAGCATEEKATTVENEADVWEWKSQENFPYTAEKLEEFCCPVEWIHPLRSDDWTREDWEEVLKRCEP